MLLSFRIHSSPQSNVCKNKRVQIRDRSTSAYEPTRSAGARTCGTETTALSVGAYRSALPASVPVSATRAFCTGGPPCFELAALQLAATRCGMLLPAAAIFGEESVSTHPPRTQPPGPKSAMLLPGAELGVRY
eukprot:1324241-Rhodomonas_salina.2